MRRWEQLSSSELARIAGGDPNHVALVPVGATEQHGPHLPTGTDSILALALCEEVSAATGAVVLPAVTLGVSTFHGHELAGTLSCNASVFQAAVRSRIIEASRSGLSRFVVVNGHVGNVAAISVLIDELRGGHPNLGVASLNWWDVDAEIRSETVSDGADWHANRVETALMMALEPGLVDVEAAQSADDPDRTGGLVFRYGVARVSRNGVTGSPSAASAQLGSALWGRIVAGAVAFVGMARTERAPLDG